MWSSFATSPMNAMQVHTHNAKKKLVVFSVFWLWSQEGALIINLPTHACAAWQACAGWIHRNSCMLLETNGNLPSWPDQICIQTPYSYCHMYRKPIYSRVINNRVYVHEVHACNLHVNSSRIDL